MTSWPMRLESQVCPTPITPVRIGIATMPGDQQVEAGRVDVLADP